MTLSLTSTGADRPRVEAAVAAMTKRNGEDAPVTRAPSKSVGGYRWVIVGTVAVILALVMGQTINGTSAFFAPLEAEFGWTRAETSLVNAFGLVGLAVGGILMGFVADRVPARAIAIFGVLVSGVSIVAASRASSLWQFYAIFFMAGAFGAGALFGLLFAVVGSWFRTGAGLAIGIASAGQAIGQGTMPLLDSLLIDALGWRSAFAAVGIVSLAVLLPLALLLRPAPEPAGGPAAAATPGHSGNDPGRVLPLVAVAVLLCCSLMSVPLVHLLPMIQNCGVSATEAGGPVLVMMIAAIGGRLAFGRLVDAIGAIPAYLIASGWQTALVLGFTMLSDMHMFYFFAPIYGFGYGGVMTCVLATIREAVPAERRASRTGFVLAFAWAGHGVGGVVGGALYDMTASYDLSFLVAAIAGCLNLVILVFLWRARAGTDARRRSEVAEMGGERRDITVLPARAA